MAEKNLFQWGPYQEAAMESGLALFGNLTTQVEKITRLQLEAGAEATREALAAAQALIEIKDPAELGNWQTTYWQPGLERVADTVRKQYDLLAESRSVVLDAIKEASAEATQQVQAGIDQVLGRFGAVHICVNCAGVPGSAGDLEPILNASASDGSVQGGPAPSALASVAVTVSGDQVSVSA